MYTHGVMAVGWAFAALIFWANFLLSSQNIFNGDDKYTQYGDRRVLYFKIKTSLSNINPDGNGLSWCHTKDRALRRYFGPGVMQAYVLNFDGKQRQSRAFQASLLLIAGDIATNPGPNRRYENTSRQDGEANVSGIVLNIRRIIKCLYLNACSIVNKTYELSTLTFGYDLIAITKPWLEMGILDSEILPGDEFVIHRKDRVDKPGGGVMSTVRSNIPCLRSPDIESDAEIFWEILTYLISTDI